MDAFTTLSARDWQLALGQPGMAAVGHEDIAQCLRIILTTPKGSDPLRPEFGCDIWRYIDSPIDQTLPHLVRECWDAITLWEPRVRLLRVMPRRGGAAPHQILVAIEWVDAAGAAAVLEVAL